VCQEAEGLEGGLHSNRCQCRKGWFMVEGRIIASLRYVLVQIDLGVVPE
jgi:hypothetical protein